MIERSIYEKTFWNEELECMPKKQIVELQNRKIRESGILERGSESSVYKKLWNEKKVDISLIKDRNTLKQIPLSKGPLIQEALKGDIRDYVCTDKVRFWFSTSGTTGVPKWIPYSDDEITILEETLKRTIVIMNQELHATKKKPFKGFFLTTPSPFASGSMIYGLIFVPLLANIAFETLIVSLSAVKAGLMAGMTRKPTGLILMPSLAMKISEELRKQASSSVKARYQKKKSLKNLLTYLITKIITVKPKLLFRSKVCGLAGEPLEPYRNAITNTWGTKLFDLYATTEYPIITPECNAHDGMHIWLDLCIAELVPSEELDKEELDPNYNVKTIFLDEAAVGATGELVLTTFGTALPLIRYRISDKVKVISVDKCPCGRTHPRIKFLRRKDDMVNLGMIRFSTYDVDKQLAQVSKNGQVNKWQIRVQRDDWKPRLIVVVEAKNKKNEGALKEEIRAKLHELEMLKSGIDGEMVLPLEIEIVPALEEQRTQTGKLKHVIYENLGADN
jgi:phenylacetate-CoA ligase